MAMDDVSKISFQALNNTNLPKKEVEKKEAQKEEPEKAQVNVDYKAPEEVMNALNLSGAQNKALLGVNTVDPTKYLTPDRIKSIETSMGVFDSKVQNTKKAIETLPELNALNEASKLELASEMVLNSL